MGNNHGTFTEIWGNRNGTEGIILFFSFYEKHENESAQSVNSAKNISKCYAPLSQARHSVWNGEHGDFVSPDDAPRRGAIADSTNLAVQSDCYSSGQCLRNTQNGGN